MAAADIPNPHESRQLQLAMRVSLAVGFLMLGTKVFAYWTTGSAAILSDAAESVVLWMGSRLIRQSIGGLMDEVDPIVETQIRRLLVEMTSEAGVEFHGLRQRNAGNTKWVEFHLLFPKDTSLESAHALATKIEERIQHDSTMRTEVISHLETLEDHHEVHTRGHFEKVDE